MGATTQRARSKGSLLQRWMRVQRQADASPERVSGVLRDGPRTATHPLPCTVEGALQFSDRLVGHRLPFRDWHRPVAALASTAEAGSLCSGRVVLSHPSTLVRSPPTPPTPIPCHFGGRLIGGVTRLEIRPGGAGVSRVTPRNCPCMPPLRRRGAGGRACACCRRTPRGSLRR